MMTSQSPGRVARSDQIVKFCAADLSLRASAVIMTETLREMCAIQNTLPVATMALSRAVMGAVLMASQMREGQQIGVHFHGDGPLGGVFAEANFAGETRGFCNNPHVDQGLGKGGFDVSAALGRGVLTVVRSVPFQKQPQTGTVPIVTGQIGSDLAHYLQQSHQTPSLISLGVYLGEDGSVDAAGGILIELMPSATEASIDTLERRAAKAGSLSQRLRAGATPETLLETYLGSMPLMRLGAHPVKQTCRCSMQRVERSLLLLGRIALTEMVDEAKDVTARCEFCGRSYEVPVAKLHDLLGSTFGNTPDFE